jgi:hypothetical protein
LEKEAADAQALKKAQEDAALKAEAGQVNRTPPEPANLPARTTTAPVPATTDANASLSKEQRLTDLTRRYKNDEITPVQYQTERAKIMVEP